MKKLMASMVVAVLAGRPTVELAEDRADQVWEWESGMGEVPMGGRFIWGAARCVNLIASHEVAWHKGESAQSLDQPASTHTCFLTKVWGKFHGSGEYVETFVQNGMWYVGGATAQSSWIGARPLRAPSARPAALPPLGLAVGARDDEADLDPRLLAVADGLDGDPLALLRANLIAQIRLGAAAPRPGRC